MLINYSGAVDFFFRIVAIIITMTITDCHLSLYHVHDRSERKKEGNNMSDTHTCIQPTTGRTDFNATQ